MDFKALISVILLILFSFIAGVVTILSPCILPVLPIVLSGSVSTGKRKPFGIVTGFVLGFTFFTLFLSTLVRVTGISGDSLRNFSIAVIFLFGLSLLIPRFQTYLEFLLSRLTSKFSSSNTHDGYLDGVIVGLSLGLIWTPCVGPIIASVITLAATNSIDLASVFITLSYALGTAIPMFAIMYGGRELLKKIPWLIPNTSKIQKIFGILMIFVAISIYFNWDRKFQTYILTTFPGYGTGLTTIENTPAVKKALESIFNNEVPNENTGFPIDKVQDNYSMAPELIQGGEWFNSQPLKLSELRGKVVLVDFWTYTCINCLRTLPYLNSWQDKYSDKGLVIVGVHSPEFEFEKEAKNVQQAIIDFKIKYPVMQDNEFSTWRSYRNRYWPAKYLINKDGKIVYTHFGEGDYQETESKIQELLRESGSEISMDLNTTIYSVPYDLISRETYLGAARMEYLYPNDKVPTGRHQFTLNKNLPANRFSFGGTWDISTEYAQSNSDSVLEYNFNAQKVYLVIKPLSEFNGVINVYLDGILVTEMAGSDVKDGKIILDTQRLYEIINLPKVENHILKLEFKEGKFQIFAFTFG